MPAITAGLAYEVRVASCLEEAFVVHLLADPAVSALIGDRIYLVMMPEDALHPSIVYSPVTKPREKNGTETLPIQSPTFRFSCRGKDSATHNGYVDADQLADAVHDSLANFSGIMAGIPVQSVEFLRQLYSTEMQATSGLVHVFHVHLLFSLEKGA